MRAWDIWTKFSEQILECSSRQPTWNPFDMKPSKDQQGLQHFIFPWNFAYLSISRLLDINALASSHRFFGGRQFWEPISAQRCGIIVLILASCSQHNTAIILAKSLSNFINFILNEYSLSLQTSKCLKKAVQLLICCMKLSYWRRHYNCSQYKHRSDHTLLLAAAVGQICHDSGGGTCQSM